MSGLEISLYYYYILYIVLLLLLLYLHYAEQSLSFREGMENHGTSLENVSELFIWTPKH